VTFRSGTPWEEARHVCDGCGIERPLVGSGDRMVAEWFFQGKPPPKWSHGPVRENQSRQTYCRECTKGKYR
jgi:hypothetical protein